MKPILYSDTETAFDTNGLGILSDAISTKVAQELNGQYELTLKYPITGIHSEFITDRCIIVAKSDPVADPQPFRIYRINPVSNGVITIYARHIAYDTMGIPVAPFTAASAAEALVSMKNNAATACHFSFSTDKSTAASMNATIPKSMWKTLGGSSGSILDVYGGEYEFDRYNIHLHTRRGVDRGVSIRYGKNLTTLEQDRNCANVYTGIYPYWTNSDGNLVQLPEKIIHAAGTYNFTRIATIDLSGDFQEAPTEEELRSRAEKYMADNDIGIPDISWTVQFVQLEQTVEYRDKALLERVLLGDTITVIFPKMHVNARARVVGIEYDSILERYDNVTLGKVKSNLADTIIQQKQEIEKKPGISLVQNLVSKLTESITGIKGGAVRLLDTNGDGNPDELYIADNADPALAVKVWRFNYEGWAASKNGYNGPFIFGATLDSGLLANFVTAAKLVAGTIQSKDGETFFLDLDNGILDIKAMGEMEKSFSDFSNQTAERFAEMQLTADGLAIEVQGLRDQGATKVATRIGYTFDDDGMRIQKPGEEMENKMDNTGMYVMRSGEPMLTANNAGVVATDVTVRNFLNMGENSRFEDYSDGTDSARTGCFAM